MVAIDSDAFSTLHHAWPFPRRWHAQVIDNLRKAGARTIVYDVQFTEPTKPAEDLALYRAIGRARNVVLATTEVDEHGHSNVLGGDENSRASERAPELRTSTRPPAARCAGFRSRSRAWRRLPSPVPRPPAARPSTPTRSRARAR